MATQISSIWQGVPNGATRAQRSPCQFNAYIPDFLVDRPFFLPAKMAADIADAERSISELQGHSGGEKNLEGLARLLLRAEAVASSFIEGLHINVKRLAKEEVAILVGLGTQDETARAVLGNIHAMNEALNIAVSKGKIVVADLCAIHYQLMQGTEGASFAGKIREEQNWIGGINPCRAEFVPPPSEKVRELLEDLCEYISGKDHSPLLQAALAHAQFETIHPFADGNGRTGRAIIHLILKRRGLVTQYVPPISLLLATHAQMYVSMLGSYRYMGAGDSVKAQSGIQNWVEFFSQEALRATNDATDLVCQLNLLEASWRKRIGRIRKNSSIDQLLQILPSLPVITVETATSVLGRHVTNVNDAVNELVRVGVLKQTTIGRRNRAFEVTELIKLITNFERALGSSTGQTRNDPPSRPVPSRI